MAAASYLSASFSAAVRGLVASGFTSALSMAVDAAFLAASFLAAFSNSDFGPASEDLGAGLGAASAGFGADLVAASAGFGADLGAASAGFGADLVAASAGFGADLVAGLGAAAFASTLSFYLASVYS